MISLDDLQSLVREVEKARREEQQLAGRVEEVRKQLKARYGVSTLKEARKVLARLQKDERRAAAEYAANLKKFKALMDARREK
jgi:hypothetical protein